MARIRSALAALGLLLALGGCQFNTPVDAAFLDGNLVFVANARTRSTGNDCVNHIEVWDDSGRVTWGWRRSDFVQDCPRPALPIVYGQSPEVGDVEVAPHRLELDRIYSMRASAGGIHFESAFRLQPEGNVVRIATLDQDDQWVRRARSARYARVDEVEADAQANAAASSRPRPVRP